MLMSLDIPEENKKQRDWEFKDWKSVINRKADNFSMNSLIDASEKTFIESLWTAKQTTPKYFEILLEMYEIVGKIIN